MAHAGTASKLGCRRGQGGGAGRVLFQLAQTDPALSFYLDLETGLVEVKEGTTTIATFEYDGAGRRTEKVTAGLTHQYIYDSEDIVEERISGSSSDTIRYYHGAGIDEPLARKNSSEVVTYYLADHLGSIVQESSAAGAVTLEREYDPWGVVSQDAEGLPIS